MRRAVVLLLLLGLMSAVSLLKAEGSGSVDPLTLAAIGFVVLASFSAAELGNRLGLPRVTGYILSGLVLGPSVLNILSRPVVVEMGMFNTLALGLIATAAGLELDLKQIRSVGRTLLATVGLKVGFCLLVVGGAALAMFTLFDMPAVSVPGAGLALALVFGALAIGTSPAIVLAVLRDSRARGRLSDLVLGAAVLKDVVVVVVLAVALAVAASLIGGDGLDVQVLVHVGRELGASALAGALLGGLLIIYVRFVNSEMLLFVSAMVLVVGEVSRVLHLELLLVFIAAGFVVRNFSRHEHKLAAPIEMVSLPVFVVFFTIVGAGIDVVGTLAILPLAAVLFFARAGAFWAAAHIGGRLGGEREVVVQRAFLGYLPQAGVTLGLIGLAAARLPELAEAITSAGMAVVALNLLVGPVALKSALRSAGELATDGQGSADRPAAVADTSDPMPLPLPSPAPPAGPLAEQVDGQLVDPGLAAEFVALAADLEALADAAMADHFGPWSEATRRSVTAVLNPRDSSTLRQWAAAPHAEYMSGHVGRSRALYEAMRARIRSLPPELTVPLTEADLRRQQGDGLMTRWRRGVLRLRSRLGLRPRSRKVALRLAARTALEPALAVLSLDLVAGCARTMGHLNETMMVHANGQLGAEQAAERMVDHLAAATAHLHADMRHALLVGLRATASTWRRHGGPAMPAEALRYSRVQPVIRANLNKLDVQAEAWREGVACSQRCVQLVAVLAEVQRLVTGAIEDHVTTPALVALTEAQDHISALRKALAGLTAHQAGDGASAAAPKDLSDVLAGPILVRDQPQLEGLLHELRKSASIHAIAVQLRQALQEIPSGCAALHAATPLSAAAHPDDISTWTVDLQHMATESLLHDLLPRLDARLDASARALALAGPRAREAVDVARYALDGGGEAEGETGETDLADLAAALGRADRLLERLGAELAEAAAAVQSDAIDLTAAAFAHLQALTAGRPDDLDDGGRGGVALARLRRHARAAAAPVIDLVGRGQSRLSALMRGLRGSRLGAEWRARASGQPFDALELRTHTERWSRVAGLPDAYSRLFVPQPVREHRLFTARRDTLDTLLLAERQWSAGAGCPTLVVGEHGSGRTSLLNMCELELKVGRLLRLEPGESKRKGGFEAALALELGCRKSAITKALRTAPTGVLVDDLERWLKPDGDTTADLARILAMVAQTRGTVLWIVTTTHAALRLLDDIQPVSAAFPRRLILAPLNHTELRVAIEVRHRLSGRDLAWAGGRLNWLANRLTGADDATLFFRLLTRSANGNPTQAMVTWMRALLIDDDDVVRPSLQRALSLGLPPFASLEPLQVALLLGALRFGGASPQQLSNQTGVPTPVLGQHAAFLLAAGLLESCPPPRDELRVPNALVGPVIDGLRELGVEP